MPGSSFSAQSFSCQLLNSHSKVHCTFLWKVVPGSLSDACMYPVTPQACSRNLQQKCLLQPHNSLDSTSHTAYGLYNSPLCYSTECFSLPHLTNVIPIASIQQLNITKNLNPWYIKASVEGYHPTNFQIIKTIIPGGSNSEHWSVPR